MFAKWQWVIASEKQPSARFCPMRIWDAHNTYHVCVRACVCVCVYTRCGFVCVGGGRRNGDQDPHPEHVHASAYGICSLSILRLDMYMHFWMRRGRELAPKKLLANAVPRTTRESFFARMRWKIRSDLLLLPLPRSFLEKLANCRLLVRWIFGNFRDIESWTSDGWATYAKFKFLWTRGRKKGNENVSRLLNMYFRLDIFAFCVSCEF